VRRVALFLIALICGLPASAQSDGDTPRRVAQAIASGPTAWVVKSVSGGATLTRPAAAPVELAAGATISTGAVIETAANGRVEVAREGDLVTISPNTRLEVVKADGTNTSWAQRLGTALFKVKTRPSWTFEVETPYMVAVVKGTAFTVAVRADTAAVQVVEGSVQVGRRDGTQTSLLRPGQTATARATGDISVGQRNAASGQPPQQTQQDQPAKQDDAAPAEKRSESRPAENGATKSVAASPAAANGGTPLQVNAMATTRKSAPRIEVAIGPATVDFAALTGNLVGNASGKAAAGATGRDKAAAQEQPSSSPEKEKDKAGKGNGAKSTDAKAPGNAGVGTPASALSSNGAGAATSGAAQAGSKGSPMVTASLPVNVTPVAVGPQVPGLPPGQVGRAGISGTAVNPTPVTGATGVNLGLPIVGGPSVTQVTPTVTPVTFNPPVNNGNGNGVANSNGNVGNPNSGNPNPGTPNPGNPNPANPNPGNGNNGNGNGGGKKK
jgi:hypothetical protein